MFLPLVDTDNDGNYERRVGGAGAGYGSHQSILAVTLLLFAVVAAVAILTLLFSQRKRSCCQQVDTKGNEKR